MKPLKLFFTLISLSTLAFISCDKKNDTPKTASLSIAVVSNITKSRATVTSSVTAENGATVTEHGFVYDTVAEPTVSNLKVKVDSSTAGTFSTLLINLLPNSTYYVRAYAINSAGITYSEQATFFIQGVAVGDLYQGGTIFYIDATGKHGLIAARSTTGETTTWGCKGTGVTTGVAIGTGQANTTAILAACSEAGIAAKFCNDLVVDGFSDWFMPSRDELKLMYTMRTALQLSNTTRWTSSQIDDSNAWAVGIDVADGGQLTKDKSNMITVRAIRAF